MTQVCDMCGKEKPASSHEYDPFVLIQMLDQRPSSNDLDPGWYSGNDGEICGPCMLALTRKSNGIS